MLRRGTTQPRRSRAMQMLKKMTRNRDSATLPMSASLYGLSRLLPR